MLIILSPAKTIQFDKFSSDLPSTLPMFSSQTNRLVSHLKMMGVEDLQTLMGISRALAELNYERFQTYTSLHSPINAQSAILSFMGDVYEGMESWKWSKEEMIDAQKRLRILSGFYGVLRPLDMIQAHRLEMGIRLKFDQYKDLYEFWKEDVNKELAKTLNELNTDIVLNLASNEYSKVVDFKKLGVKVVSPVFKHLKNNEYKIVSFWAKRARGLMTSFVIKNRITNIEDLEAFDSESYFYIKEISEENKPTFTQVF
jgi:cytoplasmic iron level regulating protein YaaA (DUF328/UPF0246 family)